MRGFALHIPALMQTEPPLNHDTAEVGMKDPAQGLSGFNPVAPSGHGRPGSEILAGAHSPFVTLSQLPRCSDDEDPSRARTWPLPLSSPASRTYAPFLRWVGGDVSKSRTGSFPLETFMRIHTTWLARGLPDLIDNLTWAAYPYFCLD